MAAIDQGEMYWVIPKYVHLLYEWTLYKLPEALF